MLDILRGAFTMLVSQPKLFVPRLVTTSAYSIFLLLTAGTAYEAAAGGTPTLLPVLAALPVLLLMDVLTYGMYASLAAQLRRGQASLRLALRQALGRWRCLVMIGASFLVLLVLLCSGVALLVVLYLVLHLQVLALLAGVLMLSGVLVLGYLFFYTVPVAVIEAGGFLRVMRRSLSLSQRRRAEVVCLNLIILVLGTLSVVVGVLTGFRGGAFLVSALVFVAGRVVQAVIYTYLSLISPAAYLREGEERG